jgi:hypothetical protein
MFLADSEGFLGTNSPGGWLKAVVMAVLAFASSLYLFGSFQVALPLAAIPLFLGCTGLLTDLAYKATALLTVGALVWAAVPQGVHDGVFHLLSSTFQDDSPASDSTHQAARAPTS